MCSDRTKKERDRMEEKRREEKKREEKQPGDHQRFSRGFCLELNLIRLLLPEIKK
jgi:hypothetical protein